MITSWELVPSTPEFVATTMFLESVDICVFHASTMAYWSFILSNRISAVLVTSCQSKTFPACFFISMVPSWESVLSTEEFVATAMFLKKVDLCVLHASTMAYWSLILPNWISAVLVTNFLDNDNKTWRECFKDAGASFHFTGKYFLSLWNVLAASK